ncbi:conserved protein, unknown function [Hepatocystis sp. ex Piliocolobus tephrosceles]|nr:conserved protein, unknown function [Hepatocystis sp. ex Piliocolobus tephrosceles]
MIKNVTVVICLFFFITCEQINGTINDPTNNRFLQSKINTLTWLTNVLYPSENPPNFKKHLDYNKGWLQTDNWVMQNENAIIEYTGKDSCREPNHPFPLWWLDNRMTTRTSLIKKDFFCKKTIAQLEVQTNDATSCGFIFRVVGERNYWGLIIDNKVLKLIKVNKGEMIVLKEFKELKISKDKWYVLFVQEIIKDIKIKAGEYGDLSIDYFRKSENEEELENNKLGSVGLFANKGNCKFRNIIFRGKKWSTEYEKLKSKNDVLLYDLEEIEALYEKSQGWCPKSSLCLKNKYDVMES